MAELILLGEGIDLNITTEDLAKFCTELNLQVLATDLETASWIVQNIEDMDDEAWNAMTVELKEWSNHIQTEKTRLVDEEKKAATVEKAQATKAANAAAAGAPTTPAAIKKAINDCKGKADVVEMAGQIARALGMDAAPKFAKSWTVAKHKEEAIANLKKPKATKPAPATDAPATDAPATDAPAKTPKPSKPAAATAAAPAAAPAAGPARAGAPSTSDVKTAKAKAAKTAKAATGPKKSIKPGEPYREGTTSHMIWGILKKSKAQAGMDIPTIKEKFKAYLTENPDAVCTNPDSRVTATIADLKNKKKILTRLETGNYILNENIK